MIVYYRETESGDFLAIDTDTNAYYRRVLGQDHFEGRATAIAGLVGSVCTTGVSREHLRACCERVAKADVPAAWRKAIGYPLFLTRGLAQWSRSWHKENSNNLLLPTSETITP